jgi:hypothetical protein
MDAEIEAYRTILREQPVTAPEVGKWMAETVQDKRRLENLLGLEPTTKLTVDDVKAMIAGLRDITRSLALADPAIKAAAYAELGITVTYHKEGRALLESWPQPSDVADVRVGGLRTPESTGGCSRGRAVRELRRSAGDPDDRRAERKIRRRAVEWRAASERKHAAVRSGDQLGAPRARRREPDDRRVHPSRTFEAGIASSGSVVEVHERPVRCRDHDATSVAQ